MTAEGVESHAGPTPEQQRQARLALVLALLLFAAVLAVLRVVVELDILDAILGAVLLGGAPGLAVAQVPLAASVPFERGPAYRSSIVSLWLVGSACWLVGTRDGGAAAIGLTSVAVVPFVLWTAAATAVSIGIMFVFRRIQIALRLPDTRLLSELLPKTRSERRTFGVLSFAAGVGEEFAYRGYAMALLGPAVGVWPSAFLTSVAFGVLHAYQGAVGIARTFVVGFLFAAVYLWSGSLWTVIVAHTLLDLIAGLVLADRLTVPPEAVAVELATEGGV
ncbi:MAG: CPBP family intramembrane glutamic endopeptidase [Gemmatimonadota bacterium]